MATDYTRRDFNTIKDDLLRRASVVLPQWTDRDSSDFGMLFVDLWAYMGDVLNYYIDRSSQEAFLETATQRESVLAIANLMDYIPSGRSAAQATVYIGNSGTSASTIPYGTVLKGKDGETSFTCYTTEDVVVYAGFSSAVRVTEGKQYDTTSLSGNLGTASGISSQTFNISINNVVASSVRLFVAEDGVNDTEYRFVNSMSDARYGERVFTTYTSADNVTTVTLGNNINGFIPPINSPISISFSTSSGSSGNYGSNTVTTFSSATPGTLAIVESTAFTGGVNEESIESMKKSIPLATRPQDRAVTLSDFVDMTLGISGIYKAVATYEAGVPASGGSVTIYPVISQSGYTANTAASIPISTDVKTIVTSELQPKALLGVTVTVANYVTLVPVNITAKVFVNERYTAGWVLSDVQTALTNLFKFDSVSFDQRLSLSTVYHTIMGVEGVDYAQINPDDIDVAKRGVFSTSSTGVSQYIDSGPTALLRKGNITLYSYGGINITQVPSG